MNSNRIMYWLVLGVFALGLRSEYRGGGFPTIHRLANHAESSLCQLVSRAEQTIALARVLSNREQHVDDLLAVARDRDMWGTEVLHDQKWEDAQLLRDQAHAQAEMMRAQVELQRSQIDQMRWRVRRGVRLTNAANRRVMLVCPKTGATITVNAGPDDPGVSDNF